MRNLKLLFFALLMLPIALQAQEKLNLAGVYEANVKKDGSTRQIYAVLDFNNCAVQDFTQLFTTPTSQFKMVPEDFLKAKKLKRRFAGTTAAGFVKYREKTLLAVSVEMKLTNPRMENGMILTDWEDHQGNKGTCGIIVNDDNSILFVGLSDLPRNLNADEVTATCVEDRCLADQPRAKSTPEGVKHFMQEYEKRFVRTTVTSCDPEIKVEFKGAEQRGSVVCISMLITNLSPTLEFKMAMNGSESLVTDKVGNAFKDVRFDFGGQNGSEVECFMPKNTPIMCTVFVPAYGGSVQYLNKVVVATRGVSANFTGTNIQLDNVAVMQPAQQEAEPAGAATGKVEQKQMENPLEMIPMLDEKMPEKLIFAVKNGVNLRKGPSTTAAIAGISEAGEVFTFVAVEGTWNVGISAKTGQKIYIAKSMSQVREVGVGALNTIFYGTAYNNHYLNSNPQTGFERNSDYTFWTRQNDPITIVNATLLTNTTTMTGRITKEEINYKGKMKGWYIVLEERVDEKGKTIEKITPTYFFPDFADDAVYSEGVKYTAQGM